MTGEPASGGDHRIPRPRLTDLLDATRARIILLAAPAGYGKTTLAREWLAARPHAWYTAWDGSADAAALASGLARATGAILPGVDARVADAIRAGMSGAARNAEALAETFAEAASPWPDVWLAIDDYHVIEESAAAATFVASLARSTSIQLLLTSRITPTWWSARDVVYGDATVLGIDRLAMTDEEAAAVLGPRADTGAVVAAAAGWPAVLGLAAAAGRARLPADVQSGELYRYFAEELFATAPADVRGVARDTAIAGRLPRRAIDRRPSADRTAFADAARRGLVRIDDEAATMHPLLREFVLDRLDPPGGGRLAEAVARELVAVEAWDEAFDLAVRAELHDVLDHVIPAGAMAAVRSGRLETLERWHGRASDAGVVSAGVQFLQGEVLASSGRYAEAYATAARAATALTPGSPAADRARLTAARCAFLCDRTGEAADLFRAAAKETSSRTVRRDALFGLLSVAADAGDPDVDDLLTAIEEFANDDAESAVRVAGSWLTTAAAVGRLDDALLRAVPAVPLLESVRDPLVRSSFSNSFSMALTIAGRYQQALDVATAGLKDVRRTRLAFPIAHLELRRAAALTGLRRFSESSRALRAAVDAGRGTDDVYVSMSATSLRIRLAISRGLAGQGLGEHEDVWPQRRSPVQFDEIVASKALASACTGDADAARALASRVAADTNLEVRLLRDSALAVAAASTDGGDEEVIARPFVVAAESGNVDGVVCALRGSRVFASRAGAMPAVRDALGFVVSRVDDERLRDQVGWPPAAPVGADTPSMVSPRELEVLDLLQRGFRNRDIARALFISESTVKVHLRHIYEKLGVSTRVQAASRADSVLKPDGTAD